jgi:hypothetical protein
MTITKFNFAKNFYANVEIADLMRLGWEFDVEDTAEALGLSEEGAWDYVCRTYHVEIKVDENGKTFWRYVNSQKADNGIDEGSDNESTGDDEQTIQDLEKLSKVGMLWNEKNL